MRTRTRIRLWVAAALAVAAACTAVAPAPARAQGPVTLSGLKFNRRYARPGQNLMASYFANGNTTLSFAIVNAAGQSIRDLGDNVPISPGSHAVDWDGYNDATFPVPDGVYRLVLTTSDPNGISGTTQASLKIDTHPPVIHIPPRIKRGSALAISVVDAQSGVLSGVVGVDGRIAGRLHQGQTRFVLRPRGGWARGRHLVYVQARDFAFNLATATRYVTVVR